jgi:hypothetical protein
MNGLRPTAHRPAGCSMVAVHCADDGSWMMPQAFSTVVRPVPVGSFGTTSFTQENAMSESAAAPTSAALPSAGRVRGPAAVVPVTNEPPPKIIVDPPLAEPLAAGRVVIQYYAENLRIVPVFGPAALAVSPRIGHIHVTVDDAPWHWADASNEPLIINGLAPGGHKVLIELVNANHQPIGQAAVEFTVPPH